MSANCMLCGKPAAFISWRHYAWYGDPSDGPINASAKLACLECCKENESMLRGSARKAAWDVAIERVAIKWDDMRHGLEWWDDGESLELCADRMVEAGMADPREGE